MTPADLIRYEAAQSGHIPLGIFSKYNATIGAGTETEGRNVGEFFRGIVAGAGVACGEVALQFCGQGVLVFLSVGDVDRALSELWGGIARCDCEDDCWIARQESDGTWGSLFPKRGEPVVLPPEIRLPPPRFFALESELKQLCERHEQLEASLRLGTATSDDAAAQLAGLAERREAVMEELASFKAQLIGGQS